MQKLSSVSLMIMGTGFLPLALLIENVLLQAFVLLISMVLNIMAIVRNLKEKRENKL
ncbi:hypothetical protein [Flavobacterium sp.]|uniref:hypothetical protein n=1 Tax=Flavobacterium sp. TaxID=239 RepID=UPI0025C33584|nr:hypothetical protein [Flavobacterium sp.]